MPQQSPNIDCACEGIGPIEHHVDGRSRNFREQSRGRGPSVRSGEDRGESADEVREPVNPAQVFSEVYFGERASEGGQVPKEREIGAASAVERDEPMGPRVQVERIPPSRLSLVEDELELEQPPSQHLLHEVDGLVLDLIIAPAPELGADTYARGPLRAFDRTQPDHELGIVTQKTADTHRPRTRASDDRLNDRESNLGMPREQPRSRCADRVGSVLPPKLARGLCERASGRPDRQVEARLDHDGEPQLGTLAHGVFEARRKNGGWSYEPGVAASCVEPVLEEAIQDGLSLRRYVRKRSRQDIALLGRVKGDGVRRRRDHFDTTTLDGLSEPRGELVRTLWARTPFHRASLVSREASGGDSFVGEQTHAYARTTEGTNERDTSRSADIEDGHLRRSARGRQDRLADFVDAHATHQSKAHALPSPQLWHGE